MRAVRPLHGGKRYKTRKTGYYGSRLICWWIGNSSLASCCSRRELNYVSEIISKNVLPINCFEGTQLNNKKRRGMGGAEQEDSGSFFRRIWKNFIYLDSSVLRLKVKVKYLRGAFRRSRSLKWPDFPCPSEPGFGITPLSSALSQLHILCVARLLPIPQIIHRRCAQ